MDMTSGHVEARTHIECDILTPAYVTERWSLKWSLESGTQFLTIAINS